MKRATFARTIGAAVIAAALTLAVAAPANADTPQQTVSWTKIGIYPRTGPSWSSARAGAAVSDGTVVTVLCETNGDAATSDVVTNDTIWAHTNIGWLPNAFLKSGYNGRTPGVADCNAASAPVPAPAPVSAQPQPVAPAPAQPVAPAPAPVAAPPASDPVLSAPTEPAPAAAPGAPAQPSAPSPHLTAAGAGTDIEWTDAQIASTSSYNRAVVARWALANYKTWKRFGNDPNNDNDCTYFVSTDLADQAGWTKDNNWRDVSWGINSYSSNPLNWLGPTKDFVSADWFKNWLRTSGYIDKVEDVTNDANLPARAQVGDIIQYDQHDAKGNLTGADGTVDHTMMIVGFQAGQALVVGVSPAPAGPNPWNFGTGSSLVTTRPVGSRIYLLHITR